MQHCFSQALRLSVASALIVASGIARADAALTVQTLFESGRQAALMQARTLRSCSFNPASALGDRTWLLATKDALLADLANTSHELSQVAAATCVSTDAGEASPITLSVPACVAAVTSEKDAAMLLVQAATKHLGVSLDRQGRSLATTLFDATVNCADDGMQLVAGGSHTCLLRHNHVECFGSNEFGESNVPELINPVLVTAGYHHSCALDATGVKCWGENTSHQLDVPGLWNVRALTAGYNLTCAIHDDGILCWGLSSGTPLSLVQDMPHNFSNPRALALTSDQVCVIDDHGPRCWGTAHGTVPVATAPSHLRAGESFGCLMDDTQVKCWGSTGYAQTTVPSFDDDVRDIAAGGSHACAVLSNRVRCWGSNNYGESTPVQLLNPRLIALGLNHSCAVDDVGVKCWGENDLHQTDVPAALARFNP